MTSLMLFAALMLQQAPAAAPDPASQVESVTVEAAARPPPTLTDKTIETQLNALLAKEPDRVICIERATTGTRIATPVCKSLRGWYDFETARNTADLRGGGGPALAPPYELVDMLKARMRDPQARALAEARARARLEAQAQADAGEP